MTLGDTSQTVDHMYNHRMGTLPRAVGHPYPAAMKWGRTPIPPSDPWRMNRLLDRK